MDEIWVPTTFQSKIFQKAGLPASKLFVVGESIDSDFYDPSRVTPLKLDKKTEGKFKFLSVFKWEDRKGWDILLKAYFMEFSKSEKVALIILTNAYHTSDNFYEKIDEYSRSIDSVGLDDRALVYVVPRRLSHEEMPSLYKACDAVVLPTRGEGWGRPHTEAMSMSLAFDCY